MAGGENCRDSCQSRETDHCGDHNTSETTKSLLVERGPVSVRGKHEFHGPLLETYFFARVLIINIAYFQNFVKPSLLIQNIYGLIAWNRQEIIKAGIHSIDISHDRGKCL